MQQIIKDHLYNEISIDLPPQRIISFVPSITETLYALDLQDQIVGRTKFCIHPASKVKSADIIGGTKTIDIEKVRALKPDLILANKEENTQDAVAIIQKEFPVFVTDIKTYHEGVKLIKELGILCEKLPESKHITHQIAKHGSQLFPMQHRTSTAIYLIWNEPIMTVGGDTYIHDMMEKCGFENLYGKERRYPTISLQDIKDLDPEYILLSSEPFPYKEKHKAQFKEAGIQSKAILVNGEMFSWYGHKIIQALPYFKEMRNTFLEHITFS